MNKWTFTVYLSDNDRVKMGHMHDTRSLVSLSRDTFPDPTDASLMAAEFAQAMNPGMVTLVRRHGI